MAKAKKALKKVAKKAVVKIAKKAAPKKAASRGFDIAETNTVILNVKFKNVEPGLSTLTATCMGLSKTIKESDTIQFDNVPSGKTIRVKGDSNGTTIITIDVDADPAEMEFEPGQHIGGSFLIL